MRTGEGVKWYESIGLYSSSSRREFHQNLYSDVIGMKRPSLKNVPVLVLDTAQQHSGSNSEFERFSLHVLHPSTNATSDVWG